MSINSSATVAYDSSDIFEWSEFDAIVESRPYLQEDAVEAIAPAHHVWTEDAIAAHRQQEADLIRAWKVMDAERRAQ
jgi:hypothetical protein